MSKGAVHTRASLLLAGSLVLASTYIGGGHEIALGPVIGVILTPDLDVDNGYAGNTYMRKIPLVGEYVSWGWDALWYFYRRSLKHGSELSHFPVVSTLGRVFYLYLFLLVIPYGITSLLLPGAWNIHRELLWWLNVLREHYLVLMGLMAADFIHYSLDIMTSENARTKVKSFNWRGAATIAMQCAALMLWTR